MPIARDEPGGGALPRREELGFGRPFESVPEGMALMDARGRVVLWNAAATRLFGHSAQEAIGVDVARLVGPALRAEPPEGPGEPFEVRALRRDGSPIVLDVTLTRYPHEGKLYALAIMRDVTRRVLAREAREARVKELTDAVDSLEAFAHVIAHDLKEPVRAMTAYLDELAQDPDGPDRREMVQRAAEANRNLKGLLEGLLDWSRTTMTPLEPRPLHLHAVLEDPGCAAQWDNLARERGARVEVSRAIPAVLATEALVCRVFGNLITNAIRHNPRPAPQVRILPGGRAARGFVEVVVEDDGPGFPAAYLQASRRSERLRTIKGGLGLAITQRALERLGGALELSNLDGGGARARVTLPAADMARARLEQRVRELV